MGSSIGGEKRALKSLCGVRVSSLDQEAWTDDWWFNWFAETQAEASSAGLQERSNSVRTAVGSLHLADGAPLPELWPLLPARKPEDFLVTLDPPVYDGCLRRDIVCVWCSVRCPAETNTRVAT